MMNRSRILLIIGLILTAVVINSCKKTYTLDPPGSKIEGLGGTWELYNVVQVDQTDLAKAERNLSSFYLGDGSTAVMKISFNSSDFTFEVTLGEIGRNYLPANGTWKFDDDNFPKFIYLTDNEGNVTELEMFGPTRPQDQQLKFSFNRTCTIDGEDIEYVGYRYEFNRK